MIFSYWKSLILAVAFLAAPHSYRALEGQVPKWIYVAPEKILFAPAVAGDGSVYFATDDGLIQGVSPSGAKLWAVNPGGKPSAAMALQGDVLYFPTSQGELAAYGTNGRMVWRLALYSSLSATPAVAGDGTVYVGAVSGRFYAISPQGFIRWSFDTGAPIVSSPAVAHSGRIYAASTKNLYAFAPDGEVIAITKLKHMVSAPMAVDAEDNLYFVDSTGSPWSFTPSGKMRWTATGSSTLTTNSASPVLSTEAVFLDASFSTPPAKTYSVSGTVTLTGGGVLPGVTLATTGATASTDSTGKYTLTGLVDGAYTVTPQLTGYSFIPATLSVTVNGADVSGQDFVATQGFSISGAVTISGGSGLQGVTISASSISYTATTDSTGAYTLSGLVNGVYTVYAQLEGYTFTPESLLATVYNASVTGIDFVATATDGEAVAGSGARHLDTSGMEESGDTYQIGAFGLTDGSQVWAPLSFGSNFAPALGADGTLYVPSAGDTKVYLLDEANGTTLSTIGLPAAPTDLVLVDTASGPRLIFALENRKLLCYGAAAGPAPSAPWSQLGGGPRHLYRRDDAPSVTLTEPQAGTVSGAVTVTADASDDFPGLVVKFFVDGTSIGSVTEPPYTVTWYSQTYADGAHTVAVHAKDTAGAVAMDEVDVTSSNGGGSFTVYPDTPAVPFSWDPGSETHFRVEFSRDSSFSPLLASSKEPGRPWLTATTWKPPAATWKKVLNSAKGAGSSPTTVYWRVVSKASGVMANAGGTFAVAGAQPSGNLSPSDGASVTAAQPPEFTWSTEHNCDFQVRVSDTQDFQAVRLSSKKEGQNWLHKTSWTPKGGAWGKVAGAYATLYWKVLSRDAIGRESTGAVYRMVVSP